MQRHYAAGITAFLIWGFIPLIIKSFQAYPIGLVLYFRIILSCILLIIGGTLLLRKQWTASYNLFKATTKQEKQKAIGLTLVGAALLMVNWLSFIYVVKFIDTQSGAFAYILCPVLTSLLGFLILKEQLNRNQWLAIGLCMLSCGLMATGTLLSFLLSFFVGLTYAFYLISQRLLKNYDKMLLLTIQLTVAAICFIPFYDFWLTIGTSSTAAVNLNLHFFMLIAILSIVFTVIPLFLNLYALKELNSGTVGVLMYLNPITGFLLAFFYFQEETSILKLVAYSIILLAVILYNLKPKKI